MRFFCKAMLCALLCALLLVPAVIPTSAAVKNPYGVTSVGCITGIEMKEYKALGGMDYFSAVVTSHIQGMENRAAIPYPIYGAIGSASSRMFVYSIGNSNDDNYQNNTVKTIVEAFERDNPAWNALVAINGDFFDIETKKTPDLGEPEGAMISMGRVLKADNLQPYALGRGVIGALDNGKYIYYTDGQAFAENLYGLPWSMSTSYELELFGEHRTNAIKQYSMYAPWDSSKTRIYFVTHNDAEKDMSGSTVLEVKTETFRRSHVGLNGEEVGTKGYYFEGTVTAIRDGGIGEKPEAGKVLISVPSRDAVKEIEVGSYIRGQRKASGKWANVDNAVGFKQQILANGVNLMKNAYGTYNRNGNYDETIKWTGDIYDYPHCWKCRTAIGFRKDGTPVMLVINKSCDTGSNKNLGASYYEIGEQLIALGCFNGFLLDGGGSSTMVIRNDDGTFSTAFAGENGSTGRRVANAVIFAVRDESVPLPVEDEVITTPTKPRATKAPTEAPNEAPDESVESDMITEENSTEAEPENGCEAVAALPIISIVVAGSTALGFRGRRERKKEKISRK